MFTSHPLFLAPSLEELYCGRYKPSAAVDNSSAPRALLHTPRAIHAGHGGRGGGGIASTCVASILARSIRVSVLTVAAGETLGAGGGRGAGWDDRLGGRSTLGLRRRTLDGTRRTKRRETGAAR